MKSAATDFYLREFRVLPDRVGEFARACCPGARETPIGRFEHE